MHLTGTLSSAGDRLFLLQSASLIVTILRLLTFNREIALNFIISFFSLTSLIAEFLKDTIKNIPDHIINKANTIIGLSEVYRTPGDEQLISSS